MQDANSDNSLPIWWHNIKFVLSGLMNPPPIFYPERQSESAAICHARTG